RDLAFAHHHSSHTGADDHADPVRVSPVHLEVGIGERLLGGYERELGIPIYTVALAGWEILIGREVDDAPRDARPITLDRKWIEGGNGGDPGSAFQRRFPELRHADADGGDDSQTC